MSIVEIMTAVLLIVAGIIHVLPLVGVLGERHLQRLYGMSFTDPNLLIMMRHRAILFGMLGLLLIAAAFYKPWQTLAIGAGLISAATFVVIALMVGGYQAEIRKVVIADVVAILALLGAAALTGIA